MMNEFTIPFGLCQIEYGDLKLIQGEDARFEALPSYTRLKGGQLNQAQNHILNDYIVTLDVSFDRKNYDILKLHYPTLKDYKDGLLDRPFNVDMNGQSLTIKPLYEETDDYNITLFDAYIEPTSFNRSYGKHTDKFTVKFVGKPITINNELSWFYIGDINSIEGDIHAD